MKKVKTPEKVIVIDHDYDLDIEDAGKYNIFFYVPDFIRSVPVFGP